MNFHQRGRIEPGRIFDSSHQCRDARIGLCITNQADFIARLFERFQVHPIRQDAQHLIQQMHHIGTSALQVLHDILAGQQGLSLLAEFFDLFDLFVKYRCLLFQVSIASFLVGYLGADRDLHETHQ
jgi:hypothetical protein